MRIKKKIAVVIGHNEIKQGAYSKYLKKSEYNFFKDVAYKLGEKTEDIIIFERKFKGTYSKEIKNLLDEIYDYELKHFVSFKFIVELHFNFVDLKQDLAKGCEVIINENDEKVKKIAKKILNRLKEKYQVEIRRKTGLIEVDSPFERGAYGVYYSDISYIVLESFFGSNKESLKFEDTEEFSNFLKEELEKFL